MDITKYLKNKDLKISESDLDLEAMTKDIREGYVEKSKMPDISNYIEKSKYETLQNSFTDLETNYNNTIKQLDDTNTKNKELNLQNKMINRGFKENDFQEVAKLRSSLYADEKDDKKAIDMIAERFKSTYFSTTEPKSNGTNPSNEPNETSLKNNNNTGGGKNIKITRKTSLSDLIITK